jgi:hypothetical protein
VAAKAAIIAEVERLHWRIWNGKAKYAQRSIKRIRKVMHVFKGEHSQGAKRVASRKLWHALHAIDKYLRGQATWLVNYAKRYRAGLRVGTSITEGELPGRPAHEQVPAEAMVAKGADLLLQVRCAADNGTLGARLGIDLAESPMQTPPLLKQHDLPMFGQSLSAPRSLREPPAANSGRS